MGLATQTYNTTRAARYIETRYNLQANPTPKRYSDFLIHQISDARAALRPVSTRGEGTQPVNNKLHRKTSLRCFRGVAASQPLECVEVLLLWRCPVCQMRFRSEDVAFSV